MTKAVDALQAAGYEPYDQPYGYAMHGNDQYPGNCHKDGYQRYQDIPEALQGPQVRQCYELPEQLSQIQTGSFSYWFHTQRKR